ncbi:hypothetical protein [Halorubellus litoreus]|uniref:Uncharacterized protein n=1 Tax=Halorubellus litoreus TaxID=755308 RepID=A0ABD5VLN4_9EURY
MARKHLNQSRRKVLKLTSSSLAGLAGVSTGAGSKAQSVGEERGTISAGPDQPVLTTNKKQGYVKGNRNVPVTKKSVQILHNKIMKEKGVNSAALPDVHARPKKKKSKRKKTIVGYGVNWKGSSPDILVKYAPSKVPEPVRRLSHPSVQNNVEESYQDVKTSHKDIDDFLDLGGDE